MRPPIRSVTVVPISIGQQFPVPTTASTAGDVDYAVAGVGYAQHRRADPRIAARIHAAIAEGHNPTTNRPFTLLNVGAGAGSYEPTAADLPFPCVVFPVEPAAAMRAQRPAHLAPAIHATAESLPFDDQAFDAAMATLTIHQWSNREQGLRELRRVTRGPVVILTFDGSMLNKFWLFDYAPELIQAEQHRFPPIESIGTILGGTTRVETIHLAPDCTDGFTEAFFARPERLLDPAVRRAQSAWNFVPPAVQERFAAHLAADLKSGRWDAIHGHYRSMTTFASALRLIVNIP